MTNSVVGAYIRRSVGITSTFIRVLIMVDAQREGSQYHFAWKHDGNREYTWNGANGYCSGLGSGWKGVSIETSGESGFINEIVGDAGLPWVWTGGQRKGRDFSWPSGKPFKGLNWSHTGLTGKRQPDNREPGGENCLAILNNFYKDGVKWHDVGCSHQKSIICEKS
ncbi:mannose-binding protein [Penaeus vannamei]|uniref:Mannose-binding protein n=1 Tax=Penaeus vannamei TaxID=6689 RepID=A0A3R7QRV2_PENVA|nr:mannose-binding protein [Penaeus vannamei]